MRLLCNEFRFTRSPKAQENLRESMVQGNNILDFMESKGYFHWDPLGSAATRSLYRACGDWYEDNAINPLGSRFFSNFLIQNRSRYGIAKHVPIGSRKTVRGFAGLRLCGP